MEVAGPAAMFADPTTGGTPTSSVVPSVPAAKGIFEAVAWLKAGARIEPTKVEICKRRGMPGGEVLFQRYTTNYGGPLRKPTQISGNNNFQLIASVVANPCYRLYAQVVSDGPPRGGTNPPHHLQDLFERRLKQGRCHRTPCLGWSEFTATYWGPFRDEFEVDADLSFEVPTLLVEMWDRPVHGGYAPRFRQRLKVEKGVLAYAQ
jgi:CRISPR-associated protein Cas5d